MITNEEKKLTSPISNTCITYYKQLVISIAKRYQNKGLDLDDLIQEGYIGLMEAYSHYRSDMGTKFSTYAYYWIRQAIVRAIETTGSLVRIPSHCNNMTTPNYKEISNSESTVDNTDSSLDFPKYFKDVPNEYHLLFGMLYHGFSVPDVALSYGVSRQRIYQIINQYRDSIKTNMEV